MKGKYKIRPKKVVTKKGGEVPNIFDSEKVIIPYAKKCLDDRGIEYTEAEFREVWDQGIKNRDEIIKRMQQGRDKATSEGAQRGYQRAISVMKRVNGPILDPSQFKNERGFGKAMLGIIRDVVKGKDTTFFSINEDSVFTRYNSKDKKIGVYYVYSFEGGLTLKDDQDDIVQVTKRSGGHYAVKGDKRRKGIDYFTLNKD